MSRDQEHRRHDGRGRREDHRRDDHRREEAPLTVAVLGAGISGLVAAYELTKRSGRRKIEVVVLEASPRAGGKIKTENVEGQVVEAGPDSFITTKPEMLELVKELRLDGDLIGTGPDAGVGVLVEGRLRRMPAGMNLVSPTKILPFLFSPLFTFKGKLRIAAEPFVPARKDPSDESLADFTRRRLGPEALERLVGPMLAGIFAGDPEKLSARSTFPQLIEMEKKGGLAKSLWWGFSSPRRRDGFTTFMTLKTGLERVVDALVAKLPPGSVRLDCPAQAVLRREGHWEIATPKGPVRADAVVCALPAPQAADALEGLDPELAMRLREIPFVSTATSTFVYDAKDLPRKPQGFGFLAPRTEGLTLTAATFSSAKFPARAAAGSTTVRVFAGGAGREADVEGAVTRLESRLKEDLDKVLSLGGARPVAQKTTRWIKANPQYDVGHQRRLDRLVSCLKSHPGLVLAGASFGGVGLPDCVRSGRRAADMAAHPRRNDERAGLA